jgi:hypothetical protein
LLHLLVSYFIPTNSYCLNTFPGRIIRRSVVELLIAALLPVFSPMFPLSVSEVVELICSFRSSFDRAQCSGGLVVITITFHRGSRIKEVAAAGCTWTTVAAINQFIF